MKKNMIIVFALLLIGGMSGCTSKESTECEKTSNEFVKYYTTIISENDKVTSLKYDSEITLGEQTLSKDDAKSNAKILKEQYKKMEGVSYDYTIKDNVMKETIELTIDNKTFDSLKESGMIARYIEGDDTNVKLKSVKTILNDDGYKCK